MAQADIASGVSHAVYVPREFGVAPTMTSLEIADLTGKRHDNVMRDIRGMLGELGGRLNFEDTYLHPANGQRYPMFRLPKRETLILVSGYSVVMRAKIIDRWQELEGVVQAPAAPAVPTNMVKALRLVTHP